MSAVPMASIITESYTKWAEVDIVDIPFLDRLQALRGTKRSARLLAVYPAFLVTAALFAGFFAVSLVLAFTTQYFLDWGSALVGVLGTAGLAVVGWLSKQEIE